MATSSALETLIELATTASDESAKRLGKAVLACEDTEQKLSLLVQYREEYESRFQAALMKGITASGCRNYQVFLNKLDTAIEGQKKIVQDAQGRVSHERTLWQASERKRMSYGTLATRAEKEALRKENKRDQKLMDEYANRLANYKRS